GMGLARRASAQGDLAARSPSPRPLSPQAGEALWRHRPLGTSGMIVVGRAATADSVATGPGNDHDEHDETGDEPCHHAQQKPLIRFHRLPKRKRSARRSLPRRGLLTVIAGGDLAIARQSLGFWRQPNDGMRDAIDLRIRAVPAGYRD